MYIEKNKLVQISEKKKKEKKRQHELLRNQWEARVLWKGK